jgi:hypothetical protein
VFGVESRFLRRASPAGQLQPENLTANVTATSDRPLFGIGESQARQFLGIALHGELTAVDGGSSAIASCPAKEKIHYILEGNGTLLYDDHGLHLAVRSRNPFGRMNE